MQEHSQILESLTKLEISKSKRRKSFSRINTVCLAIDDDDSDSGEKIVISTCVISTKVV